MMGIKRLGIIIWFCCTIHESEWIELVNGIQQYWKLEPEVLYKFYISVIPKSKTFLRYVKSKKKSKVEKWAFNI